MKFCNFNVTIIVKMLLNFAGITSVNYITSWKMISEKIEQILHSEAKAVMSFEPLYSQVYKNVCYGFSEQMHLDLISLCSKHLHNINQKLCSNVSKRVSLICCYI